MSLFSFKRMVDNLCDRRLITKGQDDTYTTHPLIKNYFESIFEGEDKKLCHKKIYQYIGTYAPERPETLEEMQPLFEQVYHGCAAGLYNDIYYNILSGVLLKQPQRILVNKLGAWETALSLIRVFFPRGEFSQTPLVSRGSAQSWSSNETELLCPVDYHQRSAQGWLLNEAGLALLATGRPKEAEDLFMRASKLYIEDEQIVPASICHQNLADLLFRVGELESAFSSAKKAVQMVEKAKTFWYIKNSKAYFAWILHLIGKRKEADSWFKHADELRGYRLHSISGVFYADFLLSNKRIDEAIELTKQNLEISKRHNWLNNISICYRCLGAIERTKGNYNKAGIYLQKALEISRNVGIFALEIEALIERGRLRLETKDYNGAEADSNQALKLIDRTGFKLYEPDAEVVLAKVYLAQGDKDEAKKFAQSAYDKAKNMSYYWPQKDAEEILKKINNTFSHNQ
jgi:tetratricopeptide (TPR) repeat protein